jgi:hypothetical protein
VLELFFLMLSMSADWLLAIDLGMLLSSNVLPDSAEGAFFPALPTFWTLSLAYLTLFGFYLGASTSLSIEEFECKN